MTVHTKWEILVQKLLKSVELFKSYGLFGEPKVVDFLFFGNILFPGKETYFPHNSFYSLNLFKKYVATFLYDNADVPHRNGFL
jgi:hypothetical protein